MNIMDKLKTHGEKMFNGTGRQSFHEIFSSYKMASNYQRKSHKRPSYTYLLNDKYRHVHQSVRKALLNLGRNSTSQYRDVVVEGAFNPWDISGHVTINSKHAKHIIQTCQLMTSNVMGNYIQGDRFNLDRSTDFITNTSNYYVIGDLFKEIKRPGYDPGEGPEASGRPHLSPVNCPGKCTSSPYRDSFKEIMECMKNCENKMIDDDIESSEKLDLRTHHDNTQHMMETKHECQLDAHCRRSQNELVNQSKCDNQEHKLGCGNTHEKKFQCSKCTREYEYKRSLHRHEQMKHKTPPIHLCTVCGKEYKYKSSLIRHMSTKHK